MDPVATPLPSSSAADAPKKRKRRSPFRSAPGRPPTHGAAMLTRVLRGVRLDRIDGRSQVGVMLRRVREDLTAHLGGEPSATEQLLVEEIAKAAIITQAVGLWLLEQQTLVKDGKLIDAVEGHARLQNNLAKLLRTLGMKRQQAERTVADVFQEQHRAKAAEPREAT